MNRPSPTPRQRATIIGILLAVVGAGVALALLLRRVFARADVVAIPPETITDAPLDDAPGTRDVVGTRHAVSLRVDSDTQPDAQPQKRTRVKSILLGFVALILLGVSAYYFRDFSDDNTLLYAVGAWLAGGGVLLLARRTGWHGEVSSIPAYEPVAMTPIRWLPVAGGGALMAILVAMNNDRLAVGLIENVPPTIQFLLLLFGVILITVGMCGAPSIHGLFVVGVRHAVPLPNNRREILIIIGVMLLGAALRFWDVEYSLRVFVDEVHLSSGTAYFWHNDHIKLLQPIGELMPFPRIFPYWMTLSVGIFGRNFTGLRFIPILFGTLTIGALYFLARTLFDRTAALVAALMLATFPPAIHFSRIALINIADPLFGILALAFLARAQRTRSRVDYALSGAMLGLVTYFYTGGRAVFPALIALWLGGMFAMSFGFRRWRPQFNTPFAWRGLVTLGLTALLIALPLLATNAFAEATIKPRIQDAGIAPDLWEQWFDEGDYGAYLYRLRNAFLIYLTLPDTGLYYAGDQPFILAVVAPLAMLGVIQVLFRPRSGVWLPIAWIMLTSFGTSLLEYSTITARYVLVLPALALLLGIGLRYTVPLLIPGKGRNVALAVAALAVAFFHLNYYYNIHLPRFNEQFRAGAAPDVHDALLRAADLPPGTAVHLISDHPAADQPYADQVLGYLTGEVKATVVPLKDFGYSYLLGLTPGIDQAFFIERDDDTLSQALPLIQQFFQLSPPERTPYPVPFDRSMWLYLYDAPE